MVRYSIENFGRYLQNLQLDFARSSNSITLYKEINLEGNTVISVSAILMLL